MAGDLPVAEIQPGGLTMHHTDRNAHRAGFACADIRKPLPRRRSWLAQLFYSLLH